MLGTFDLVIAGDGINVGQITHEIVHCDELFSDANNQSDISAKNNKKENTLTYGSYVKKTHYASIRLLFFLKDHIQALKSRI